MEIVKLDVNCITCHNSLYVNKMLFGDYVICVICKTRDNIIDFKKSEKK